MKKIILAIIGIIIAVSLALSFIPFFSSYQPGGCKDTPEELYVDGFVLCPHTANFWQYTNNKLVLF